MLTLRLRTILLLTIWLGFGHQALAAFSWREQLAEADSLGNAGELDLAIEVAQAALTVAQAASQDTAQLEILERLSDLEKRLGRPGNARTYLENRLNLARRTFGFESPENARSLMLLCLWEQSQGYYERSDSLGRVALAMRVKLFGEEDVSVASALNNLAITAYYQAKYDDAEQMAEQAIRIYEKTLGPKDTELAACLNTLGMIYWSQERLPKAAEAYQRSLSIMEEIKGNDHPDLAHHRLNTGIAWWNVGQDATAESLYALVWSTCRTRALERSALAATLMRAWGQLCKSLGRYGEAATSCRQNLAIDTTLYGTSHPDVAMDLNNLGDLFYLLDDQATAEKYARRALAISEARLGSQHPLLENYLTTVASIWCAQERIGEARGLLRRAFDIRRQHFREGFAVLSEPEALLASQGMRRTAAAYLSFLLDKLPSTAGVRREIAEIVLSTKGQISDGIFVRYRTYADVHDPHLQVVVDSLRQTQTALAEQFARAENAADSGAEAAIRMLMGRKEQLEIRLARQSAEFRRDQELWNVTAEGLAEFIPPDAALVEFLRYQHTLKGERTERRYLALVLLADGSVYVVPLGAAEPIDQVVARYRAHLFAPEFADTATYYPISDTLYQRVWRQIEQVAGIARTVYVAPDGPLNFVSFAGLRDTNGLYLIEKYAIHYLGSARDLLRYRDEEPAGRGLLAMGDPDFDATREARAKERIAPPKTTVGMPILGLSRGADAKRGKAGLAAAPRLPATRHEVESIAAQWRLSEDEPASVFLGEQATEENLRVSSRGRRAIHLATHGYALSGTAEFARGEETSTDAVVRSNPLICSGLLLAGANHRAKASERGGDDGLLTAEEVAALNLSGTQFVVLSACVTGLGRIESGEGVYGLRRAFQLAGARTVLCSLWPVSDDITARAMSRIYSSTNFHSLPEQMRQVALERLGYLRRAGLPDHPKDWAAFIAIGDWRWGRRP